MTNNPNDEMTAEPELVKVYASFPNNESITIEVEPEGAQYAVESFYEIGAVFSAPVA